MKRQIQNSSIDAALLSLEEVLANTMANYPLLKQHMNIHVVLEMEKPSFNLCLEQDTARDLKRQASLLHMKPEELIENLVLEYLYDDVG